MDLSAFPTPRPTLNVILLASASLCIFLILRQLLKGLVYWIKQEHAFWGMPTEPVASLLYGHAPLVSATACGRVRKDRMTTAANGASSAVKERMYA